MYEKAQGIVSAFDKALDKNNSFNYRLSIQLSLDGFSFCLINVEKNKLSGLEAYQFQGILSSAELIEILGQIVSESEWLPLKFQHTGIVIESPKTTLVPQPLFDDAHPETHLDFDHNIGMGDTSSYDQLRAMNAVNVYALPEILLKQVKTLFPGSGVFHIATPLIESLMIHNKNSEEGFRMYVNVRHDYFDIVLLNRNRLEFYNMFLYKSPTDFAYYIIYVIEQMNLNPETVDVILLGEIKKSTACFEILFKYVRNIRFYQRNEGINYSYVFNDIPEHAYFTLLNLHLCE